MHSLSLAATTLFVAGALAGNLYQLLPRELQVRQGSTTIQGPDQSYTPRIIQSGFTSCAQIPEGTFIECGNSRTCYEPAAGEICCPGNGNNHPCGPNSYCFVGGRCCPNGLPAQTCAEQYNIPLPENFSPDTPITTDTNDTTDTTDTDDTPSTPSASNPVVPTTSPVIPTPIPLPSPIPDTAPYPIPSPIPGNATFPGGPAAPTGTGALPPVVPFTGAAGSVKVYCGGLIAGALGVVGMVL